MNRKIVHELERLRQHYDEEGDVGREQAYRRAIQSVEAYDQKILSGQDAMQLPGIATGIGWRIDKVLGTHTVDNEKPSRSQKNQSEKVAKAAKAARPASRPASRCPNTKMYEPEELPSRQQPVKVTFCDAGSGKSGQPTSMTSDEGVSREGARKLLQAIQVLSGTTHVVLADQYRRGYREMSQLVFLFTEKSLPKSIRRSERDLRNAISALQTANVLSDVKTVSEGRYSATAKFRSGKKIKCLFIAVPASEWPFALIRYTGPADTWKRLQNIAESKKYRLTERALFFGSTSEICHTEKEIFQYLGLVFIPPEKR